MKLATSSQAPQRVLRVEKTEFGIELGEVFDREGLNRLVASGVTFPIMICPHRHVRAEDFIAYSEKQLSFAFDAAWRIVSPGSPLVIFSSKK